MDDKRIPDDLCKEICACTVLHIQNFLFTEKPQMKMRDQYDWFFDAFHGNPTKNITSQLDMVLCGQNVYSALWDSCLESDLTLTNPCTVLRLKSFLSRDQTSNYYVGMYSKMRSCIAHVNSITT